MTVDEGSGTDPSGAESDIRETVRMLTSQVLRGGQVDPKGVEEVVRRMTAAATGGMLPAEPQASPAVDRQALLDDLAALDRTLTASAESAHAALMQITTRGTDFTDNDLKEAFARLRDLQQSYVETVNRIADAATGNVQRELRGLAGQAQRVGADAGARVAVLMSEFANRINESTRKSTTGGFDQARDYGMHMSMLAGGVLAGIADGLSAQTATEPDKDKSAG